MLAMNAATGMIMRLTVLLKNGRGAGGGGGGEGRWGGEYN